MKPPPKEYLRTVDDDGLAAEDVGPWAEDKYRLVGMYAEIFSTGMKNRWDHRVYIDLFAGSGHAIIRDSRRRVLTSPMLALEVRDPFDYYIFCDDDLKKLSALEARTSRLVPPDRFSCVHGDANAKVDEIASHIPQHTKGDTVLSFCFADPYNLNIHFETIRRLAASRAIDFVVLLALWMDANRNWSKLLESSDRRIEVLLGDPEWRQHWAEAEHQRKSPVVFLAEAYAAAMRSLGYQTQGLDRMIKVRSRDNNLPLYYLAFFSKNPKGYAFWEQVRKYSIAQLDLEL